MNYPPPPPHTQPPKSGMPAILWAFVALGLVMLLFMGGAFAWGIVKGFKNASRRSAPPPRAASLPQVERHVPEHDPSILDGCSSDDVDLIVNGIGSAIDVGAPLYNTGDFAGCYHLYDGTASDIERRLPATCSGPKRALAAGQTRASKLATPSAQAWAMRDAFDGLLDVTRPAR